MGDADERSTIDIDRGIGYNNLVKPSIGLSDTARHLGRVNLNHLLYFWAVARSGSVTAASRMLGLAQPTISEQLRSLEQSLGTPLVFRGSRGVTLTPAGERVMRHAEEVVGITSDLLASLPFTDPPADKPLIVGTADAVPKSIVRRILQQLITATPELRIVCREWRIDHLLAELSLHRIDLVITDDPADTTSHTALASSTAGQSPISVFAAQTLARRLRRGFPATLKDAPMLVPATGSPLRSALDRWFAQHRITPRILVEAEDRSHLHNLAESGLGAIPGSDATAPDLRRQHGLERVGQLRGIKEDYILVMVDHPRQHPAVVQLRASLAQGPLLSRPALLPVARARRTR